MSNDITVTPPRDPNSVVHVVYDSRDKQANIEGTCLLEYYVIELCIISVCTLSIFILVLCCAPGYLFNGSPKHSLFEQQELNANVNSSPSQTG